MTKARLEDVARLIAEGVPDREALERGGYSPIVAANWPGIRENLVHWGLLDPTYLRRPMAPAVVAEPEPEPSSPEPTMTDDERRWAVATATPTFAPDPEPPVKAPDVPAPRRRGRPPGSGRR